MRVDQTVDLRIAVADAVAAAVVDRSAVPDLLKVGLHGTTAPGHGHALKLAIVEQLGHARPFECLEIDRDADFSGSVFELGQARLPAVSSLRGVNDVELEALAVLLEHTVLAGLG